MNEDRFRFIALHKRGKSPAKRHGRFWCGTFVPAIAQEFDKLLSDIDRIAFGMPANGALGEEYTLVAGWADKHQPSYALKQSINTNAPTRCVSVMT